MRWQGVDCLVFLLVYDEPFGDVEIVSLFCQNSAVFDKHKNCTRLTILSHTTTIPDFYNINFAALLCNFFTIDHISSSRFRRYFIRRAKSLKRSEHYGAKWEHRIGRINLKTAVIESMADQRQSPTTFANDRSGDEVKHITMPHFAEAISMRLSPSNNPSRRRGSTILATLAIMEDARSSNVELSFRSTFSMKSKRLYPSCASSHT